MHVDVVGDGKCLAGIFHRRGSAVNLPETLGNPYGLLGRAALDLMGFRNASQIELSSDIVTGPFWKRRTVAAPHPLASTGHTNIRRSLRSPPNERS
jgi:hypothetical protein